MFYYFIHNLWFVSIRKVLTLETYAILREANIQEKTCYDPRYNIGVND